MFESWKLPQFVSFGEQNLPSAVSVLPVTVPLTTLWPPDAQTHMTVSPT